MTSAARNEEGGLTGRLFHQQAHIVSHTHWDREWYEPAGRFRQRLVALIDELLDGPPTEGTFLLDGQTILLEDYLAVRPERTAELSALLREGRLEAGPWYVLADELIPSGEALVRNLLVGRRALKALRADPPPVLYCPDSFGHPAALPVIASGFGCALIILWRGFGSSRWPASDLVNWHAADGSAAHVYHLPRSGYEIGANLPTEARAAAEHWRELHAALSTRNESGVLLVLNGADHHARQSGLDDAVNALRSAAAPQIVLRSSLRQFAAALDTATRDAELRSVRGELRDSYGYTWTLQGTFATRAYQKRHNARIERLLTRECEPFAALASLSRTRDQRPLVQAAWRALLQCHPHDTLCGCSLDDVAVAMDARLADAESQALGLRGDAIAMLVGHDAAAAHTRSDAWQPTCVVWNASARARGGVAEVTLDTPLYRVPVGPGSGAGSPSRIRRQALALDKVSTLQRLSREVVTTRADSPRHYPMAEMSERTRALVWVEPIAGYGSASFTLRTGRSSRRVTTAPIELSGLSMENGKLRVSVTALGTVRLEDRTTGRIIDSLVSFEDVGDRGDLYTHSPIGEVIVATDFLGARVVHAGPLRGEMELRFRMHLPASRLLAFHPGRARPRPTRTPLPLVLSLSLDAGSPFARVAVRGVNSARDHRLRVVLHTGVEGASVFADAAFGPVRREPIPVTEEEARVELPPETAPLHRYVSLFGDERGATVFSDGLAEYEAKPSGDVAITLLRAVGQLSRNNLPERPGHAGWPSDTPAAQCLGPFEASFAFKLHGPRDADTIESIEQTADDVLLPLRGVTIRTAIDLHAFTAGLELFGRGLAFSSAKQSEDGQWLVLRCVNLLEETVTGSWRLNAEVAEAHIARLDETILVPAELREGVVSFTASPRAVVTILVRPAGDD